MPVAARSIEAQVFPFRTLQAQPGLAGTIKTVASDFRVNEQLAFEPEGTGEHVYLHVTKTDANTGWVASQIAAFCGLREMDVSFAGRKDRHAVTRQWFSCYLPGGDDLNWSELAIEGAELGSVTRHRRKLRRGEIKCNGFEIIVRHDPLTQAQHQDLNNRLTFVKEQGFPNYFGPQRFGRDGENLASADRLLRQREKVRDRGMALSAARSWLFNLYLSGCIEKDASVSLDAEGPLIGKSRDEQPGESDLDEQMTAWVEGLRRLGMKVDTRKLFVRPDDFQWETVKEGTCLGFKLPSGSFATSLLREVFEVRDAASEW